MLAESDQTLLVEGNRYFPWQAVKTEHLRTSRTRSNCFWKGEARYLDVVVKGKVNPGAAWYYPDPKPAATAIKAYIAFWHGVRVE